MRQGCSDAWLPYCHIRGFVGGVGGSYGWQAIDGGVPARRIGEDGLEGIYL